MRRSYIRYLVVPVAAALPLFMLAGCEDGPNQTFQPAPTGAGNVWNGPGSNGIPNGSGYTGSGTTDYDAGYGGANANITCTADQSKATWAKFFQQPVLPPGIAAGVDIAGGYDCTETNGVDNAGCGDAHYTPGQ